LRRLARGATSAAHAVDHQVFGDAEQQMGRSADRLSLRGLDQAQTGVLSQIRLVFARLAGDGAQGVSVVAASRLQVDWRRIL